MCVCVHVCVCVLGQRTEYKDPDVHVLDHYAMPIVVVLLLVVVVVALL